MSKAPKSKSARDGDARPHRVSAPVAVHKCEITWTRNDGAWSSPPEPNCALKECGLLISEITLAVEDAEAGAEKHQIETPIRKYTGQLSFQVNLSDATECKSLVLELKNRVFKWLSRTIDYKTQRFCGSTLTLMQPNDNQIAKGESSGAIAGSRPDCPISSNVPSAEMPTGTLWSSQPSSWSDRSDDEPPVDFGNQYTNEPNSDIIGELSQLVVDHDEPANVGDLLTKVYSKQTEYDRRLLSAEKQIAAQQRIIERQQQTIAEMQKLLQHRQVAAPETSSELAETRKVAQSRMPTASIEQRVEQLEAIVTARDAKPSLLRDDLKPKERGVLQAILDLPADAFTEAERLIGILNAPPMTDSFCRSMKAVLKAKDWGVVCTTCRMPSTIVWVVNRRNAEGGKAQFTHTGPSPHGSITRISNFNFVKKLDRRKRVV